MKKENKKKLIFFAVVMIVLLVIIVPLSIFGFEYKTNSDNHLACKQAVDAVLNSVVEYRKLNSEDNSVVLKDNLRAFMNVYEKSSYYEVEKLFVLYMAETRLIFHLELVNSEIDGWVEAFTILSNDYNDIKGYVRLDICV